jgi:hypothetical protein
MDTVISKVADIVGNDLTAAKKRIASGRAEITSYVKSLPVNLRKVGADATEEINDRFQQLENDVNSKQDAVVDALASKYVQARKGLDDRIEELQAENRGLVDKAIGAIKAVINTIRELASMLMNVLARVAGVVGDIIKHPVRFLGNLIDGVKGGILKFKDTILEHLRKGLLTWLFGALAEGGVELPDSFDIKGILKMLASIFGLTWRNIRNRIVKQIGEPAMSAVEKGVEIFSTLASQGVGGLWQMLVDKLGDIKEMILEQVKDFVVTRIITAGITWLISLLNPVAAFVKACKLIYEIVMFFVNNAGRIVAFINTVIDSVADMVRGNVGAVVDKVDDALGKMVPLLIGFLADVIGLGGVGEKIRSIVHTLQKPITKAVDLIVKAGLKLAAPIIRGIKGISSRVKAKVASGKAWVRGKVEAGKQWAKDKLVPRSARDSVGPAVEAGKRMLGTKGATPESVRAALPGFKTQFGLHGAALVRTGHLFHIHVQKADADTPDVALGPGAELDEARKYLQQRFVVTDTHRVATVVRVDDTGWVTLQYDLERTIGGTSQTKEGRPVFPVSEFVQNMKTGGPRLVPAGGGPNQTTYTLDRRHLRPQYIGEEIRRIFYRYGYQAHRDAVVAKVAKPDGRFLCPGWPTGQVKPHWIETSRGQLDHRDSVAGHWQREGHKVPQSTREAFDTDINNLQLLCDTCNRAKSSYDASGAKGSYVPVVEIPNFSGPNGKT